MPDRIHSMAAVIAFLTAFIAFLAAFMAAFITVMAAFVAFISSIRVHGARNTARSAAD